MERLRTRLEAPDVRGVAESAEGEVCEFRRKGVIDLYELVTDRPHFLHRGKIADRVIGKGAALLLTRAGVAEVFACVISQPALEVLTTHGITVTYITLQPHIINRRGDGICPVEAMTYDTDSPDIAYDRIGAFLKAQHR